MLKFLKKLFKTKEKLEIKLDELQNWFNEKTKQNFEELNPKIGAIYSQFKEEIEKLKEQVNAFENAEIKDEEKIEPRVKQIVKGNRQNYIRQINIFLDNLQVPEAEYKDALKFCSNLEKKLDELAGSTKKSFYTAQHLFHKEVEPIAKTISGMASTIKELKQAIEKSNAEKIDSTKTSIQTLNNKINAKKQLSEEFEKEEKNYEEAKEKKEEIKKNIKELEQSKEFTELHNLKSNLESVNKNLRLKEDELIQLFASMDRALKKFSKMTFEHQGLIEKYLASPIKTLLEDEEFKIIDLIKKMKQPILDKKIDLKDRKKEKVLNTIDSLTKDYLVNFLSAYNNILEDKRVIENKIDKNTAMQEKNDLDYKLESFAMKITRLHKLAEELKQKHERIDIEKMKKELTDTISSITDIEITL